MAPSRKPRVCCVCAACSRQFEETQFNVARGRGKFCSPACRASKRWPPLAERFAANVSKCPQTGCWFWTGSVGVDGYASIYDGTRNSHASRVSWQLHRGSVPDGLCVLHNCPHGDNPLCVNPDHLWLGTKKDNYHDMVRKGRRPERRERKLDLETARFIRKLHAAGEVTIPEAAASYGVSIPTVWRLLNHYTYREPTVTS